MLCGEYKLHIKSAPLAVSWTGTYELQATNHLPGPWSTLFRATNHTYTPIIPPHHSFFRLKFPNVYR